MNSSSQNSGQNPGEDKRAMIFSLSAALVFSIACFWNTDAEVYLFPRIIAGVMLLLSVVQLCAFFRSPPEAEHHRVVEASIIHWKSLMPGLIIALIYVLCIESIGFYTGSLFAFLGIVMIYGKRKFNDPKALLYKLTVGVVFMLILYGLFWTLLYVRTPTGWLI